MTTIEWTSETWNPVVGCTRVSSGCDNCYAINVAHRQMQPAHVGLTKLRPRTAGRPGLDWNGEVRCLPERLETPLRWRKPRRVFVNSMSDLFHESVPFEFIVEVFATMARTPRHTYQVLTKRPARALTFLEGIDVDRSAPDWPLPNVWLGVSAEDQATWDERVPLLLQCPAAVRFVSAEPLLGPLQIRGDLPRLGELIRCVECGRTKKPIGRDSMDNGLCDQECPGWTKGPRDVLWPGESDTEHRREHGPPALDWVIVGGESGPGARVCHVDWIRSIAEQCKAADVPVFVKQLGRVVVDEIVGVGEPWPEGTEVYEEDPPTGARIQLRDRKGKDMAEWPPDLRVRQFPEVQR